jgi:glycosyltransferase involved in cell wall biosynthesis
MRGLRVTFCLAEASSYFAACLRALAQFEETELSVIHLQLFDVPPPWREDLLAGLEAHSIRASDGLKSNCVLDAISESRPEAIVLCGWFYKPYVRAVLQPALSRSRVIVGMDSPWRGTLAQRLNRVRLWRLLKRLSLIVVAGERSRQYALRLGVPDDKIVTGYYGCDYTGFENAGKKRVEFHGTWPRSFLFAGRYVSDKGLDVLMRAYKLYAESVSNPWTLTCCGVGPLAGLIERVQGVLNLGYVEPSDMPRTMAQYGTLVLPSLFEPWGVVIAEACASGMPVVCTNECGAGVDLVRPYYNGVIVPKDNAPALAGALRWIHQQEEILPTIGARSKALSEAYSATAWATRWYNYLLAAKGDPF